jgi:signal transduction histidine kinase
VAHAPSIHRGPIFLSHLVRLAAAALTVSLRADSQVDAGSITNLHQLRQLAESEVVGARKLRLEGEVWWSNPAQGRMVWHDTTGTEVLELASPDEFPPPGARVRLEGTTTVTRPGYALRLGSRSAVVDNDGVHALIEKRGRAFLEAGAQPFRLEWFNGVDRSGLELEIEGPDFTRQPVAGFLRAPGLEIRYYEVAGNSLPDFSRLTPIQRETTTQLNLANLPKPEHVGASITGVLEVPRPGVYTFHLRSDDGSRLYVGQPTLRLTAIGKSPLPPPRRMTVGQLVPAGEIGSWVEVEGKVTLVRPTATGWQLELSAGAGHLRLEFGADPGPVVTTWMNTRIRAVGFGQSVHTPEGQTIVGILLVPDRGHIERLDPPLDSPPDPAGATNANGLPLLTTASAVHQLKRDAAQRGYPVNIRGVVTCVLREHQAFTIQDATRGLYVVDFSPSRPEPPRLGEYLEVEGNTDPGLFAPVVNARLVKSVGAGHLPEPVKPTWDQIINGSLDAQLVELQGIVTAIHTNGLTLLMRGGVIKVELRPAGQTAMELASFENALVRIRGCLLASWDYVTHQVNRGDIRIYAADLVADQPAPEDLFAAPRKTASELLLFDPQAGVFQRVRVAGQIVHERDGEYFLMDEARGLRFLTKQPVTLETGDLVELVGFPDLFGSAGPLLREAAVRRTGHAPLPPPRKLAAETLIRADHDSTLVQIEGVLINAQPSRAETALEMQTGVRTFVARLKTGAAPAGALQPGSRLELTGVYAGLGGNRAAGQEIAAFELLMNSGADVRVLARPPWWTLKRLLVMVGVLAGILAGAGLWISQLHRQVEQRTTELGAQIQERQQVEHQRAMEQERTRIAQDLHDELGSGITEISMLAARAKSGPGPDAKRGSYLEQMGGKARELVTALDEIVWAMNPHHDSLASLVSYLNLYADRFLSLASIAWQLEGPDGPADQAVNSRSRHQLFLAFKEALTNIVRHSGATEVRLRIRNRAGELELCITDNGRGLPAGARTANMDGVANMRARIEKIGGRFEIDGRGATGTAVRFTIPTQIPS